MRILVCDQNKILLKAIEFRLKQEGHQVIPFSDGRSAYNYLTNETPDVFITDIFLPFISGLELVSFCRTKLNVDFPIIILSRLLLNDTIELAYRLGADDYITKPFDLDLLEVSIKKTLIAKILSAKNIKIDIRENKYSLS